ncbi:unnamed protein product [Protopolystoma xenopodis]|uniref:Uncharacterized protein n=1 Tax=Protopolystoma xenopodis TaxID=117903 RepID=A0A448WH93_9PLAT|nr:unnamed protein product [Protopolystoma xenopodis]
MIISRIGPSTWHIPRRFAGIVSLAMTVKLIKATSEVNPLTDCVPNSCGISSSVPGYSLIPDRPITPSISQFLNGLSMPIGKLFTLPAGFHIPPTWTGMLIQGCDLFCNLLSSYPIGDTSCSVGFFPYLPTISRHRCRRIRATHGVML